MRRRPSRFVTPATIGIVAAVVVAGCTAPGYVKTLAAPAPPRLTVVVPQGNTGPLPAAQPDNPTVDFDSVQALADQATDEAADAGADITLRLLDRSTGQTVDHDSDTPVAIASVAKLFIADDLLLQESKGQTVITPEDRAALDAMLRKSDDNPAENFWNRSGGNEIIERVAARYGLESTKPPSNSRWWNTTSTAADLVRYYDMLMSGSGGLPPEQANIILSNLSQSEPVALDGTQPGGVYPQRFGIPDGLPGDPVAVKQGWMCVIGSDWMHLSTGVIGADRRYIMVISSEQSTNPDAARETITEAVKTMFPAGRI